jgi:hypothetical protein
MASLKRETVVTKGGFKLLGTLILSLQFYCRFATRVNIFYADFERKKNWQPYPRARSLAWTVLLLLGAWTSSNIAGRGPQVESKSCERQGVSYMLTVQGCSRASS